MGVGRWVAAAGLVCAVGSNGCSGGGPGNVDGGTPGDGGGPCTFLPCPPDSGPDGSVPDSGPTVLHPSVRAIDPPDGYTFVGRDTAVKVDVNLPNVGKGVDVSTLTSA